MWGPTKAQIVASVKTSAKCDRMHLTLEQRNNYNFLEFCTILTKGGIIWTILR